MHAYDKTISLAERQWKVAGSESNDTLERSASVGFMQPEDTSDMRSTVVLVSYEKAIGQTCASVPFSVSYDDAGYGKESAADFLVLILAPGSSYDTDLSGMGGLKMFADTDFSISAF